MGDVPQGGGAASPQPGLTALVADAAGFIDPCGFRTIRERARSVGERVDVDFVHARGDAAR